MKAILSEDHFINYINYMLRKYQAEPINLLNREDYIRLIYNENLADQFCDELKRDLSILDSKNIQNWINGYPFNNNKIKANKNPISLKEIYGDEAYFTDEFIALCESVRETCGIYNFWCVDVNKPLYIGRSYDLGTRIITSFLSHKEEYIQVSTKASYANTSYADAIIYELYFINLYKPVLNRRDKTNDALSLTISPLPKFSEGVLVLKDKVQS